MRLGPLGGEGDCRLPLPPKLMVTTHPDLANYTLMHYLLNTISLCS